MTTRFQLVVDKLAGGGGKLIPMNNRAYGFTIVELLIVIVVIAILATLGFLSYTNIQQRAHNTQIISAVNAYQKALQLYASEKGTYPVSSDAPAYGICLGDGYADPCWSGISGTYSTNATLDTVLGAYMSGKPTITPKYYAEGSQDTRSGIVYFRNEPTGNRSISYILEGGSQPCSISGATIQASLAGGAATRCRLILPGT